MNKTFLALLLSIVLIAAGIATAFGTIYQRSIQVRGWADPTTDANLPDHLPLAGVNVELTQYDAANRNHELDRMVAAGFVWIRQTFLWSDIEPTAGQIDFSKYDPIVEAVSAHKGLRLVAVLDSAPGWARRADAADRLFAPPASMNAFGVFAGKFAAHYSAQIDYYQIWDEPNLNIHWGGLDPRPTDYAAMLKATYTAIHSNDPTATVITAGLAPTVETGPRNISDPLYLNQLYEAGAADAFDAVAGKPYGFDSSPQDRTVNPETLNFSHIILLREEMVRHGDGRKALWGSHFGWNHLPTGWSGQQSSWGQVDAETQRRYTRDAYTRAAQEWPWMGGLILEHWQPAEAADNPIQGFAVSNVAADWFEAGAFFANLEGSALKPGLYPATEPRFHYQGDWRFGSLGADVQNLAAADLPVDGSAHLLNFTFEGSALAFRVRRADYVGFMYIRVDGQPTNALPRLSNGDAYIILKTPDLQAHTDLIVAANNLGPGIHNAEVRTYLSREAYGNWILASVGIGTPPDTRRSDLLLLLSAGLIVVGLVGSVFSARRIHWRAVATRPSTLSLAAYLRRMTDVIAGLVVSGLALIGMALTFNDILPNLFQHEPPTLILTILTVGLAYFSHSFLLTIAMLIVLWLIIYNRPVVGLALIIFWAPFFLTPMSLYLWAFPMVEVSLALTLSAVVVRGVIGRAKRTDPQPIRWTLADGAILAFTVVAAMTLIWSEQRNPAAREWRTMVIEPVLFYLLLRVIRPSARDVVRLVDVLLLAGLTISVIGLMQLVLGRGVSAQGALRLQSVYESPNNAALFLGRCIPFGLAILLVAPGLLRRAIAALVTLIMLITVVMTQSAGALLLGIPAGIAVVLLLWDRRRGALIIAGLAVFLVGLIILSPHISRLQGLFDLTRSSSFVRIQLWTSTAYMLRDHPITGVGLDQFLYQYRSRYILPDAYREPNLSHPHNFILDYWVSLGILGLAILAALQLAFWRNALNVWRQWRLESPVIAAVAIGAMGSMGDFLGHGIVDNSYFVIDLAYVFCFSLALVTILNSYSKKAVKAEKPEKIRNEPSMQTTINNVSIELLKGDITALQVDAIVNAANSGLILGAGVAGAIARRGGPSIQEECLKIGHCPVGEAVITGGGSLPATYVIHAVGPRMGDGDEPFKLASAIRSSLHVAEQNHLESIALPAISTGVFGYPLDDAAKVILQTILRFAQMGSHTLKRIILCLYDDHAYQIFADELQKQLDDLPSKQDS